MTEPWMADSCDLVRVQCGVDEYGEPTYRLVPADTATQWDDRVWRDHPI